MSSYSDRRAPADDSICGALEHDPEAMFRVRVALASEQEIARTTAIFSALADPTRLRIIEALSREELCVCDLASLAGVSQSGVSHQLRILRDRGLVAYRREGNRAVYRLADDHVRDLLAIGVEHAGEAGSR